MMQMMGMASPPPGTTEAGMMTTTAGVGSPPPHQNPTHQVEEEDATGGIFGTWCGGSHDVVGTSKGTGGGIGESGSNGVGAGNGSGVLTTNFDARTARTDGANTQHAVTTLPGGGQWRPGLGDDGEADDSDNDSGVEVRNGGRSRSKQHQLHQSQPSKGGTTDTTHRESVSYSTHHQQQQGQVPPAAAGPVTPGGNGGDGSAHPQSSTYEKFWNQVMSTLTGLANEPGPCYGLFGATDGNPSSPPTSTIIINHSSDNINHHRNRSWSKQQGEHHHHRRDSRTYASDRSALEAAIQKGMQNALRTNNPENGSEEEANLPQRSGENAKDGVDDNGVGDGDAGPNHKDRHRRDRGDADGERRDPPGGGTPSRGHTLLGGKLRRHRNKGKDRDRDKLHNNNNKDATKEKEPQLIKSSSPFSSPLKKRNNQNQYTYLENDRKPQEIQNLQLDKRGDGSYPGRPQDRHSTGVDAAGVQVGAGDDGGIAVLDGGAAHHQQLQLPTLMDAPPPPNHPPDRYGGGERGRGGPLMSSHQGVVETVAAADNKYDPSTDPSKFPFRELVVSSAEIAEITQSVSELTMRSHCDVHMTDYANFTAGGGGFVSPNNAGNHNNNINGKTGGGAAGINQNAMVSNNPAAAAQQQQNQYSGNRRMAYYAVGKHPVTPPAGTSGRDEGAAGSNPSSHRRCYFTGKLIRPGDPFYAGSVQQGLRTLVVFCLPRALGLPRKNKDLGGNHNGHDDMEEEEEDDHRLLDDAAREALLRSLPDPNQSLLDAMRTRYPGQFATLPVQVRSPHCWRLFVKFCFFSGLPIAEGEMHYRVKDQVQTVFRDLAGGGRGGANDEEEVILSHEVMEAVNGEESAEILRLPNKKTFAYLRKNYAQQSSKLNDAVFHRTSWEVVLPEF